jgi:hypothetical protein
MEDPKCRCAPDPVATAGTSQNAQFLPDVTGFSPQPERGTFPRKEVHQMRKATYGIVAGAFLLAGCATSKHAAEANKTPQSMAAQGGDFELHGSRIIGCCCQTPCSCRVNKKPMHCHGCDFTTAVHIDSGHFGTTDMSGLTWAVVGRGFGQDPAKNWVTVYVSDKATDAQVEALKAMLDADVKDWEKRGKVQYLAGTFKGVSKAPMTYTVSADKKEYDFAIDDGKVLDLKTHAIVLPGHTEPARLTGIFDAFGDQFVQAECLAHTYHGADGSWDLTGRQCNQADFVLTNERVARGGIGWGCWSAHEELGDKAPYPEQMKDDPK